MLKNHSLAEVYRSVGAKGNKSFWRFMGPGFLVSVGYMDPGNWATDLAGGSKFGYTLIWVILLSNLMAIFLQTMCARLGIAGQMDLAQASRMCFKKPTAVLLWILAEIAMIATDVAEVIGSAVALYLLFGLNKVAGVLITGLDVLLILGLMKYGFRKLEAFIIVLVVTIGVCFLLNLIAARPDLGAAASALIPRKALDRESLTIAIGIIGATVMPHNLYLHSSIVQTRDFDNTNVAIKSSTIDTIIALGSAFFVNAAILVLAAAVFYKSGQVVDNLEDAHKLLAGSVLGGGAATLFAVALLASGQSSTITGTLTGQIVMEGFMQWKIQPWMRRMITRGLALIPAIFIVLGTEGRNIDGLVVSQVLLSLQLPFAIFPLVYVCSKRKWLGDFASPLWMTVGGLLIGGIITYLNIQFLMSQFGVMVTLIPGLCVILFLLWSQFMWKPRNGQPEVSEIGNT